MSESSSIILLHGTDEFAVACHLNELRAAIGDSSTAEMNIAQFDGHAGLDFEALNTAVNAIPFLAARRLVILAHPVAAFSSPALRKKFNTLLANLPPTTTLALAEYDFLKDDHWLMKWARSSMGKAKILVCMMPRRWEMTGWIQQETNKQGGKIEGQASGRLVEMVGEDTRIAAQEITKLLTYVNYARPVSLADVEQVSIVSAQGSVFDLVDALGTGNGQKAQKMLHQLLESEDPFSLWGMVIRQFRLLLLAREVIESGGSQKEVEKALGIHSYVAQKVYDQARRFTMSALESIYHKLLKIDEGAKTGQVPLDLALDMLVVELAGK
jgi:DNA polymerase-3 subunit delta